MDTAEAETAPAPADAEKQVGPMPAQLLPPTSSTSGDGAASPRKPERQRWNDSRVTIYRFSVTLYSFFVIGMNDGCTGALIPYLESYYNISYSIVSLMFLMPFVGYLIAAMFNNLIHHRFGQFGVAVAGPLCRLIGYVPICTHPPFPVLPVVMLFPGFGNGIEDSAWNAWIGNMHNANELLGILHGIYGLGATAAPLIATFMIAQAKLPWYSFYYVLIGLNGLGEMLTTTAFWTASAAVHRGASCPAGRRTTTRTVLRAPVVWLVAIFLLGYVGVEVSLGGWVVTFMLRVRHAAPFWAGLSVTFFWLGLTVGRVALGFLTPRVGEKGAIAAYLVLDIALVLLYWLVPSFAASAVFAALLGLFLGPLYPAAIVGATKLLPADHHISAIGFAAAVGGVGGAVLPFAVGAMAQSQGVAVLQPIVLALLVLILLTWLFLPGGLRRGGLERASDNEEKIGHEVRKAVAWAKGGGRRRTKEESGNAQA